MWSVRKFLLVVCILFLPLYLLRLRSVPVYQIPGNTEVRLRGRITRQPYLRGSYQIIYLGPVLIKTNRFPAYFYHQKIEVIGKFERKVINRFQAQYTAYFPAIQVIEEKTSAAKKSNLIAVLLRARGRVEKVVGELLAEPQSSLLLGIVFGAKKQMPQDFWQDLQRTGTLHVVVASGQNVAIVAWLLIETLVWFISRRKAMVVSLAGVTLYVLMAGAEAPVVRGGIMAVVAFAARFWGREEEGTIALLIAAVLMLLISPLILFDIGFQLSFAATAGLIWICPFLKETPLERSLLVKGFGEAFKTSLAAQLAVMPIILINFGQVSMLSPLINALVLWVVPLVMVLGSTVAALALIIRPIAQVLAWFVWLLLTYFVKIIEVSGKLPGASLGLGKLSVWWAVGYYLVLIWAIVTYNRKFRVNH